MSIALEVGIILYMHFKMYILFLNYVFQTVSFSCISGKTEDNDEKVFEVKQKTKKLESMTNGILCFLMHFMF